MSGADGLEGDLLKGKFLINLDSEEEGIFTIGSAGGEHVNITSSYQQVAAPADMRSYLVKVQGLHGRTFRHGYQPGTRACHKTAGALA